MQADSARSRVLVSIDDEHAGDPQLIVQRLRAAGLQIEATMEALGTVAGSIDPERIDVLRAVEGVVDVEPAREHQLPPPDADLQ